MNYRGPPMGQFPPNGGERNFGTDLHMFMDGLNRIVQILYSSIPVIELLRLLFRYTLKFCHYLGMRTVSLFYNSSRVEVLLEQVWADNRGGSWYRFGKFSVLLAIGAAAMWAYNRQSDLEMLEDAWEDEFEEDATPEEIAQRRHMAEQYDPYCMEMIPPEQYSVYY